jgi:hypothetical protein
MSPHTNVHAPRTSLSGRKVCGGGWWVVGGGWVVCKPILVFSFDFGQAEQKKLKKQLKTPHKGPGGVSEFFWGSISNLFVRINPL